jgi:hypothetical protein
MLGYFRRCQTDGSRGMDSEDPVPSSPSKKLPDAFSPLDDERSRIERILDRLETTENLTERANLGSELVRSVSRYEDTLERVAWPLASESNTSALQQLADDRETLRNEMVVIQERTTHVDPRNVHVSDPQGFEDALEGVAQRVRAILPEEDRQITIIEAALGSPDEREEFTTSLAHALHHASERPNPPGTALGRAAANMSVKLDHVFRDASTSEHLGDDTING